MSSSKLTRPAPFTPKRPTSTTTSMERLTRATVTPNTLLASTHKYKAPISSDVKRRSKAPNVITLAPVPGSRPSSPTKSDSGRPTTPGTPRDASLMRATSEMDVSNVDPEQVLVDFQTVEPADVSLGEMDEAWLKTMQADHGKQDKVMVSVRLRPGENTKSAWIPSVNTNSISLDPSLSHGKATSFTFDAVLTGTPNKPIFTTVAKSHVIAAVEGFNSVIFAYGQTASGKTYTLSGTDEEPGIIPRAMKQVFGYIRREETREYLLRCSYLEIYNEQIHDLLAPPGAPNKVELHGGSGGDVILTPLREEVVTSIKGVRDVLKRGESHRRTACTDWNERSSRSHSVFRLVIESRERADTSERSPSGRATPSGRQTPGANPNHGGPRLQSRGGKSVQTSVLSLIDLAGSEKATSDKERTREGQYINKSLLTLGTVIGKLSDNAAKGKNDHIPFRDSKLTRLLAPSLSGNARISVVCTINPDAGAVAESTSTLLFAKRVKGVKLQAQKREVLDRDALIERYEKEIGELRKRLEERERESIGGFSSNEQTSRRPKPRMSAQEKVDESQAMKDLQARIAQLTKLILNSQTVSLTDSGEVGEGEETRPVSPSKAASSSGSGADVGVDFSMDSYQLQQALLTARLQLSSQATQILSLEAALAQAAAAETPVDASADTDTETDKDKIIEDQARRIRALEEHHTYNSMNYDNLDEKLGESTQKLEQKQLRITFLENALAQSESRVRVLESNHSQAATVTEKDLKAKLNEKERWAEELVKQLEKEKRARVTLEDERRVLRKFVERFDELGMGMGAFSGASSPMASPAGRRRSSFAPPVGQGMAFGAGAGAGRRRSSFAYGYAGSGLGESSLRHQSLFPSSVSSSSTLSDSSSVSTSASLSRFTSTSTSLTSVASGASSSSISGPSSPQAKSESAKESSSRFRESYDIDSPFRIPHTPHGVGTAGDIPRLLDLPTPDFKEAWVVSSCGSGSGLGDVSFEYEEAEVEAMLGVKEGSAMGAGGLGVGGGRVPSVAGGMTSLSARMEKSGKPGTAGTVRFASSVGILGGGGEGKENVTPLSR